MRGVLPAVVAHTDAGRRGDLPVPQNKPRCRLRALPGMLAARRSAPRAHRWDGAGAGARGGGVPEHWARRPRIARVSGYDLRRHAAVIQAFGVIIARRSSPFLALVWPRAARPSGRPAWLGKVGRALPVLSWSFPQQSLLDGRPRGRPFSVGPCTGACRASSATALVI